MSKYKEDQPCYLNCATWLRIAPGGLRHEHKEENR